MTLPEPLIDMPGHSILNLERALREVPHMHPVPEHMPAPQPDVSAPSPQPLEPPAPELTAEERKAFYLLSPEIPEDCLQQFRQLRGRLFRMQVAHRQQRLECASLLITSPAPRDGKSFIALNLALMMAVAPECRILLADVNVRRPSFCRKFGFPEGPGVRQAVAGASWRSVSRRMPGTNLFVAGLGQTQPGAGEHLDYDRLGSWLDRVSGDFDWLLLDGPSLDESPDAEMLSFVADKTLMVLRSGRTRFDTMDRCMARLEPGTLAGAVLNR